MGNNRKRVPVAGPGSFHFIYGACVLRASREGRRGSWCLFHVAMGRNMLRVGGRGKGEGCSTPPSGKGLTHISSSSSGLQSDMEGEFEGVFKRFDANGDGKISSSELGAIMHSFGNDVPDDELRRMMEEADSDGDGFINLQEFIHLNTNPKKSSCLEDLKVAFQMFDLDKSGSISALELHKVLKRMGDQSTVDDCRNMIRSVDRDGDGLVNFEEFKIMMTKPSI